MVWNIFGKKSSTSGFNGESVKGESSVEVETLKGKDLGLVATELDKELIRISQFSPDSVRSRLSPIRQKILDEASRAQRSDETSSVLLLDTGEYRSKYGAPREIQERVLEVVDKALGGKINLVHEAYIDERDNQGRSVKQKVYQTQHPGIFRLSLEASWPPQKKTATETGFPYADPGFRTQEFLLLKKNQGYLVDGLKSGAVMREVSPDMKDHYDAIIKEESSTPVGTRT